MTMPDASRSMTTVLRHLEELYALPPVVAHFSRILGDPDVTAQDVADTIATDVVMAAKVLRLVNSSYFGFSRRIGSLKTAIVILGFKEIRKLVFALGTLRAVTGDSADFSYATFLRHSVAVGILTEALLTEAGAEEQADGFVAGLLHDVGKLVVAQEMPELFGQVRKRLEAGHDWIAAELAVLGFHHAELGGALAAHWRFPAGLVTAIRNHHDPMAGEPGQQKLAAAVGVSDLCVRACLVDLPGSGRLPPVDAGALELLGIDGERLDPLFGKLPAGLAFVDEVLRTPEDQPA